MNRFYFPPPIFSRYQNHYISKPQTEASTLKEKIEIPNVYIQNNKENIDAEENVRKVSSSRIYDTVFLDFNGIKLKGDDLLILLLIFFLYKQKIKDNLLLIALFSLLF